MTLPDDFSPLFGVEIETFVKLKKSIKDVILRMRRNEPNRVPDYFLNWDFGLQNGQGNLEAKVRQRHAVGECIHALITRKLGANHGWKCEPDASLKEWDLSDPPEARYWWGIEIISPPMSSKKRWQDELEKVFDCVSDYFDFWTNACCACHVHVSHGPDKRDRWSRADLIRIAKGAYFWEDALMGVLPIERRTNRYANPNHTLFASDEYRMVPTRGWGPLWAKLDQLSEFESEGTVAWTLNGGHECTRYVSTSFSPLIRLGTVELRRQAGVASATTAIRRALLAMTLQVSALRYNFNGARNRRNYPDTEEMIKELAGCIKHLPKNCLGSVFVGWLKECHQNYYNNFTERQINASEKALLAAGIPRAPPSGTAGSGARSGGGGGGGGNNSQGGGNTRTLPVRNGPPPSQPSSSSAPRPAPARRNTNAPSARTTGANATSAAWDAMRQSSAHRTVVHAPAAPVPPAQQRQDAQRRVVTRRVYYEDD